jgi:hypothetical protein
VQASRTFSFNGDGEAFRIASEAQRIRLAHLFDPYLAVLGLEAQRDAILSFAAAEGFELVRTSAPHEAGPDDPVFGSRPGGMRSPPS